MKTLSLVLLVLAAGVFAPGCGGSGREVQLAPAEDQPAVQDHMERMRQMEQRTLQESGGAAPGGPAAQ